MTINLLELKNIREIYLKTKYINEEAAKKLKEMLSHKEYHDLFLSHPKEAKRLDMLFYWNGTVEGHNYWHQIHRDFIKVNWSKVPWNINRNGANTK